MSNTQSGKIIFVQNYAPRLTVGDYEINAQVNISSQNPGIPINSDNQFKEQKKFFVSGERFNINISEIDSVCPPENSEGNFEDTLPHLVFSNLNLPWLRHVEGKEKYQHQINLSNNDKIPWIALLLFSEDDPAPSPKTIKLKELSKTQDKKIWFPPNFALEFGEKPEDECQIIDVPINLFKKIAPSLSDLRWLAHGRIVNVDNKIQNKGATHSGKYSVIIGNRLPSNSPEKSIESKVHVVLLEGYAEILANHAALDGFHSVRLVSIKNWRFSCKPAQDYSFSSLIDNLDKGKDQNAIFRYHAPRDSSEKETEKWRQLFDLGYVPMQFKMRQGYDGISFYRSPLVSSEIPLYLKSNMLNKDITAQEYVKNSISNQDELYRFDPVLKIYDLSYASAWQIGQLLALQNKTFSKSLYNLKRQLSQKEIKLAEGKVLKSVFGKELSSQSIGHTLNGLASDFKTENHVKAPTVEPIKAKNPFQREKPLIRQTATIELPHAIMKFAEDLKRLEYIPFHYLVPDLSMLPMESIRFFQIDPNWIAAVLEGAMSLGEFMVDRQTMAKPEESSYKRYGFLIRSSVLVHWPGLEIFVNPKNKDKNPKEGQFTKFLRLERLAPDIAICIAEKPIKRILFREPGEGLHFGLDMDAGENDYKKIIKDKDGVGIKENFKSKEHRTIKIADLADAYKAKISDLNTGDFGYQMVQGVETVQYNTKQPIK